jgi:carboxypeptidase C (cathepsin A)
VADDKTSEHPTGKTTGDKAETTTKPAEPKDDLVSSKHHLRVGRRTLDYTATTGRVVLRDEVYEDGTFTGFKPKAEMSLTSYVVDDGGPDRPVTFAFNGGPGSSRCGCTSASSARDGC